MPSNTDINPIQLVSLWVRLALVMLIGLSIILIIPAAAILVSLAFVHSIGIQILVSTGLIIAISLAGSRLASRYRFAERLCDLLFATIVPELSGKHPTLRRIPPFGRGPVFREASKIQIDADTQDRKSVVKGKSV